MNVDQILSPSVPILSTEDTGDKALALMEDSHLSELPIVHDEHYMGLVRESDLLEWADTETKVGDEDVLNFKPAIPVSSHPFEALRVMYQMSLSVLPVVDQDQKYVGSVTPESLMVYMAQSSSVEHPGGIIVLEVAPRSYSLFELARICENEDVMVLNMQSRTTAAGMLEVSLKLNKSVLEPVVSSFERHGYNVKEVYGEQNNNEDIETKYNLLMNYINM